MAVRFRKLYVWLIAFGLVFVGYAVYSGLTDTGPVEIDRGAGGGIAKVEWEEVGEATGRLGPAKVGQIKTARYITKDREWGFDKLLNPAEGRDDWELEKPYMNIFKPNFRCEITAERGIVRVEELAAGKPSPKDARLWGNVIIHIFTGKSRDIRESYLYLDDVVFVSEKSQFSTAGPVRFVSQDAEMVGTGMEAVYNEQLGQLEFLRVVDLEFLRLKTETGSFASSPGKGKSHKAGDAVITGADVSREAERGATEKRRAGPVAPRKEKRQRYYECLLNEDVVIEYGRDATFFAEEVWVNNILWSSHLDDENTEAETKNATMMGEVSVGRGIEGPSQAGASESTSEKQSEIRQGRTETKAESAGQTFDVVVTCAGGITMVPAEPGRRLKGIKEVRPGQRRRFADKRVRAQDDPQSGSKAVIQAATAGRSDCANVLRTEKIDYDMLTGNATATRDVEFTFYSDAASGEGASGKAVPVVITAKKQAVFLPGSNQVVFEGDVVGTMVQEYPAFEQQDKVYGEKLVVTLSEKQADRASAAFGGVSGDLRHIRVVGRKARLESVRRTEQEKLSHIRLTSSQIDYDTVKEELITTGRGIIEIDNSKAKGLPPSSGQFSLRRPCFALVEDFEKLYWFMKLNRIVADAQQEGIHIRYLPLVNGGYGQLVSIDSSHIEIMYMERADGETEVAELTATGGIIYEEGDKQFEGAELFYDAGKSVITVQGRPCYFNGARFGAIKYDLKTGAVKTELVGAGTLQMP